MRWKMKGKLKKVDNLYIYYHIDTTEGQSGSSISYQVKDDHWTIGTHRGSQAQSNVGTRLSIERTKRILKWMESYISLRLESRSSDIIEL